MTSSIPLMSVLLAMAVLGFIAATVLVWAQALSMVGC